MNNHIRKYILLTLTHVGCGETAYYTPHSVVTKCRTLFNCESILVAKKLNKDKGYHYYIGILNDNDSRYTATKVLSEAFPKFEGGQLNVFFHKSWNTTCEYVFKQDSDLFFWGTIKEQCFELLHRKNSGKKDFEFISRLRACHTWSDVIRDNLLADRISTSYSLVRQLFLDIKKVDKSLSVKDHIEKQKSIIEQQKVYRNFNFSFVLLFFAFSR